MKQGILSPQAVNGEVDRLSKLNCSPRIANRIMNFLEHSNPSLTDLAQWISLDQILTARILKLANAHNYEMSGQISTLNLAIITIGFDALKELLISISAIDQFHDTGHVWPEQEKMFWLHSACVGEGARRLSTIVGYPTSGEAFVAGLLHDLGHQVIAQVYPEYFTMVTRHAQAKRIPRYLAEKELLGFDHGQVGRWLAQSWNFPANIIAVIEHHHMPDAALENKPLVQLIHVANLICHSLYYDGEPDSQIYSGLEDEIIEKLEGYFTLNSKSIKDFQDLFKIDNQKSRLLKITNYFV
jgi:HD-like signal output (HDOD) protein